MKIGYVRVSSVDQNEARQIESLEKLGVERIYQEKISAKDTNRPKLQEMLDYVREGDTVYIHDFSRLARSTKDLLNIVELLEKKKVKLVSIKESLDTSTAQGRFMLTMLGAIYEFERANMLERQREGIAIAKREGKYKGGKAKVVPNFDEHYALYISRKITKAELAKKLGVSRPTLDKLIQSYLQTS